MKRLFVELSVPDALADGLDAVEVTDLVVDAAVDIKRARWYPLPFDTPAELTHIGWLNPDSGALHRNKFSLRPGPDWIRLFIFDPAMAVQVDGGELVPTLTEAIEAASYEVSLMLHTGERLRLVREPVDCGGSTAFVYRHEALPEGDASTLATALTRQPFTARRPGPDGERCLNRPTPDPGGIRLGQPETDSTTT